MAGSDDSVLSHAEYWDGRYKSSADVDAHGQAHEWFRSFASLEPFLREHLFDAPGLAARDEPAVLHLGSGDSVRDAPPFPPFPIRSELFVCVCVCSVLTFSGHSMFRANWRREGTGASCAWISPPSWWLP